MTKINLPNIDMDSAAATAVATWGFAVADLIVVSGDRKVRLGDLTPAGVHYVATYGYRKSLQDSVSGVKDAIAKAAVDKDSKIWAKFAIESGAGVSGEIFPPHNATIAVVSDAVLAARMDKRNDAIVASSIPVKDESGRLSGRDKWIRDFATATIANICANKNAAMPKGEELESKRAKYIAARPDFFESAWQAHVATLATASDVDLDSL